MPPGGVPPLPGTLPPPESLPATTAATEIARFQGRAAALAPGITWIEGRIEAGEASLRVARLVLEGPPADVLALAADLATTLPLLPARMSLHEMALALAEGREPRPRRSGPADLGGARSVEQALCAALGHLLEVVLAESARCTLAAGPRGVHQSRVALRRLRSLLRIFRPVVDGPEWREWDGQLKHAAAVLGEARDWDVFLAGLGEAAFEALGRDPRLKRMLGAAGREREAAYGRVAALLHGPDFRAAIWSGVGLLALRPSAPPDAPLGPFATGVLRRRWRRLRRVGEVMEGLDATALHEMRLDAKRLRYAAEPFAALWRSKAARRFNKRLAGLQEALGLANDAVVAQGLAERLAGKGAGGFALGAVAGFAVGRAEGSRLAALEAWGDLHKAGPFWKHPPDETGQASDPTKG